LTGALAIEGLSLESGPPGAAARLVENVSLRIAPGRTLALVGASGGGKSLTTLALLGLLPPGIRQTAGTVRLGDAPLDPDAIAALRGRVVGLVQQSPALCLNPLVTIGRHFRETLACDGLRGGAAIARAVERLAEVGLPDPGRLLALYPFQLSGGMQQRVVIALALARNPDFLLADEPTTDLDLTIQAQILDLLAELRRTRGIGLLLVTHDLSVVARMADEVAVMAGGTIVEHRPVAELFRAPRDPRTRSLMRIHFRLHGAAGA
jgi:nickel transport system ATP-binding protein